MQSRGRSKLKFTALQVGRWNLPITTELLLLEDRGLFIAGAHCKWAIDPRTMPAASRAICACHRAVWIVGTLLSQEMGAGLPCALDLMTGCHRRKFRGR